MGWWNWPIGRTFSEQICCCILQWPAIPIVSETRGQRGSVCVVDAMRGERVRDIPILLAKLCVCWVLVQNGWCCVCEIDEPMRKGTSHKVDESE